MKLKISDMRNNTNGGLIEEIDEIVQTTPEDKVQPPVNFPSDGGKISTHIVVISMIEMLLINQYFINCRNNEIGGVKVNTVGHTDNIGTIYYRTSHVSEYDSLWFNCDITKNNINYRGIIVQTTQLLNDSGRLIHQLNISSPIDIITDELIDLISYVKNKSFENSKYIGQCLDVSVYDGRLETISIVDVNEVNENIILNDTQERFLTHFKNRIFRGGTARFLLNGEPGSGKTESIRNIVAQLVPNTTFIIPKFETVDDLFIIMDICSFFDHSVMIIDDIDLYLGSRDRGNYTNILGRFLSFFDGIKKRKISLIASTNSKELVDKAAERPGRFNMILDFGFLDEDQINKLIKLFLPEEYHNEKVYNTLLGLDSNGNKKNITGAFLYNLGLNIKEMREDDENWSLDDTILLIKESYDGFYNSQVSKHKKIGFN